jgi:cyclophilin family peptidyl-prolyl cis-trans isomerase
MLARRRHRPRRMVGLESLERRLLLSGTIVEFETSLGSIQVELYDNTAPLTVENFLNYVADDDWDDSVFHRSVNDFIVQGGGFTFPGFDSVPTDSPVPNEFGASNLRGTIAMAKLGGDSDSATSQWFFNLGDNSANLDNQNGGFTVFGEVIGNGMDVVDDIADVPIYDRSDLHSALSDIPLRDYTAGDTVTSDNVVMVHDIRVINVSNVVEIGNGAFRSVTYTDDDGTVATVALYTGNATITFAGAVTGQKVSPANTLTLEGADLTVARIDMTATNRTGALVVTAWGGDGVVDVEEITSDGALGSIFAGVVQLEGELEIAGGLGWLWLGDVEAESEITVGASSDPNATLFVRLGHVTDTNLTSQMPISFLTATSWTDDDTGGGVIEAPGVGTVWIAGGDMDAEMDIGDGGVGTFIVVGGDLTSEVQTSGAATTVLVAAGWNVVAGALAGGDFSGTLDVAGDLLYVYVLGDMTKGARVHAGGRLSGLIVLGGMLGGADDDERVTILAPEIDVVTVIGNVEKSRILAGAWLGTDWEPGGTGDAFSSGTLAYVTVIGDVSDSLIGAGLTLEAGAHDFDLPWLAADAERLLAGSSIGTVYVGGALTSNQALGPYGIAATAITNVWLSRPEDEYLVVTA